MAPAAAVETQGTIFRSTLSPKPQPPHPFLNFDPVYSRKRNEFVTYPVVTCPAQFELLNYPTGINAHDSDTEERACQPLQQEPWAGTASSQDKDP